MRSSSAQRVAKRYASTSGFFSDYKQWTLPDLLGDRRYRSWWVDRRGKLVPMKDDPKNSPWGGADMLYAAKTAIWKGHGEWEVDEIHFEFLSVNKDFRGHGVGRQVLTEIVKLADKNKVALTIQPKSMGGPLSKIQLTQWYKRYGFEALEDPDHGGIVRGWLIRYPS